MPDDQPAPQSERTSAGPVIAAVAVVLLFVLPAVYVLGLGPAVQIHKHASPPVQKTIEVIYFPVDPLIRWLPAVRGPLGWYVTLWGEPPLLLFQFPTLDIGGHARTADLYASTAGRTERCQCRWKRGAG
jgi:hypothetical protein